jgi:hypothetical protein
MSRVGWAALVYGRVAPPGRRRPQPAQDASPWRSTSPGEMRVGRYLRQRMSRADCERFARLLKAASSPRGSSLEQTERTVAARTFVRGRLAPADFRKIDQAWDERVERHERTKAILRNRIQPEQLSDDPNIVQDHFIVSPMACDATPTKSRRLLGKDDYLAYWAVIDRLSRVPGILELLG